jgi:hypothetical protein
MVARKPITPITTPAMVAGANLSPDVSESGDVAPVDAVLEDGDIQSDDTGMTDERDAEASEGKPSPGWSM